VLGDPVSHSKSPVIQQEALRRAGLEGEFLAIKADEEKLVAVIEEMRAGEFDGLNVTMPLKEVAAGLVGQAGAINTLRCKDSVVEGVSTDTAAFRGILEGPGFRDVDNVLILGAGGSALSALAAMSDKHLYLSARNESRVSEVVASHDNVMAVPWKSAVAGAIVINCTPLGMSNEDLPKAIVDAAGALIDLPYGPPETPSVGRALKVGIPVVDGYEFLARQAAASFEWWTGVVVDFKSLAEIARNV
jgi:shikimate dehydrogenase